MSRKYKFNGYMDDYDDREKKTRSKHRGKSGIVTEYRKTMKCSICGQEVNFVDIISVNDKCKNCGSFLHSCKNCVFFDPSQPRECMKKIENRIADKNDKNNCKDFTPRVLVEKKITKTMSKSEKARKAFDDLFKI